MRVEECSSIDDLLVALDRDIEYPHRFPSRFILIHGLETWREVIKELGRRVGHTIRLSGLCRSQDVLPDVSHVSETLLMKRDISVMVLPVSELLRFQPLSLHELAAWMELEHPGETRYYFPLFDSDDMLAQLSKHVHRYGAGELSPAWRIIGGSTVHLEAAPFDISLKVPDATTVIGIQRYLTLWESGGSSNIRLKSKQTKRLTDRIGSMSVRAFQKPIDYLSIRLGDLPKEGAGLGSEDEWKWLLDRLGDENSLALVAANILNMRSYEKWQVFDKWASCSPKERWVAWLWTRINEPNDTYLGRVICSYPTWNKLQEALVLDGFNPNLTIDDLSERKQLLVRMEVSHAREKYWQRYQDTTDDLARLRALWGGSERQKKEAIHVVSRLLRDEVPDAEWHDVLELVFPQLSSYLRAPSGIDNELSSYILTYVRAKLTAQDNHRYLESLEGLAKEALETNLRLRYPPREQTLESNPLFDYTLWVDAMGLEWLELLKYELAQRNVILHKLHVARSNLPSITETNKGTGWDEESQLERELDNISHKSTYHGIAERLLDQFDVIKRVADRVSAAVNNGRRVAITSDHGLTALLSNERIDPLDNMEVDHSGRFGSIDSCDIVLTRDRTGSWVIESRNGQEYVCLANHSRYRGRRSSSCETHGGATIEESLVPILFVTSPDGAEKRLPNVSSLPETVRLDTSGRGIICILLDDSAESVELRLGANIYAALQTARHEWTADVSGILPGRYTVSVVVDDSQVQQVTIRFIKGIVSDDMGI
jgi:hypothetical protein